MEKKEITIEIKSVEMLVTLGALTLVFILQAYVSLNYPIVFGDEGFHARMSWWIAEHNEYPVWSWPHSTKSVRSNFGRPPLLHLTLASFLKLFGMSELVVKLIIPFISFMAGIACYFLGKEIYNRRVGVMASIMLTTIPSFVTYAVLIYVDVLVTLLVVMFLLFLVKSSRTERKVYWVVCATFGALAFLTKTSGFSFFILLIFALMYEIIVNRSKAFGMVKRYAFMLAFALLLCLPFLLRNFYYYKTPMCGFPYIQHFFDTSGCLVKGVKEKYSFLGRVVEAGTEQNIFKLGITNYFDFAYGNLFLVLLGFSCGLSLTLLERRRSDVVLLLMLLIFLGVFSFSSWGRAEDAARYTLAWAPVIVVISARYFDSFASYLKNLKVGSGLRWVLLTFLFFLLGVLVFVDVGRIANAVLSFAPGFHGKIMNYLIYFSLLCTLFSSAYTLFLKKEQRTFVMIFVLLLVFSVSLVNCVEKLKIMAAVKSFSPAFFEACDWVKRNLPKNITLMTIWGHRAIYACERNAVGHIPDITLSKNATYAVEVAKKIGITHLFIQKFSVDPQNRHLAERYDADSVRFLEDNPKAFIKVFENGPSFKDKQNMEICLRTGGCDGNIIYEVNYSYVV